MRMATHTFANRSLPQAWPIAVQDQTPTKRREWPDDDPGGYQDRLSERTHYRDTGCEIAPRCLECPLPHCKYDLNPKQAMAMVQEAQVRDLLAAGNAADAVAAILHISRRSVFRLKRGKATAAVAALSA